MVLTSLILAIHVQYLAERKRCAENSSTTQFCTQLEEKEIKSTDVQLSAHLIGTDGKEYVLKRSQTRVGFNNSLILLLLLLLLLLITSTI